MVLFGAGIPKIFNILVLISVIFFGLLRVANISATGFKMDGYKKEDSQYCSVIEFYLILVVITYLFRFAFLYKFYYWIYNLVLFWLYNMIVPCFLLVQCKFNYKKELGESNYKEKMSSIRHRRNIAMLALIFLILFLRIAIGFYGESPKMFKMFLLLSLVPAVVMKFMYGKNSKIFRGVSKDKIHKNKSKESENQTSEEVNSKQETEVNEELTEDKK